MNKPQHDPINKLVTKTAQNYFFVARDMAAEICAEFAQNYPTDIFPEPTPNSQRFWKVGNEKAILQAM